MLSRSTAKMPDGAPAAAQSSRPLPAWRRLLLRFLWWEPFWIALLAPSLLFPGRFWILALQPLWVVLLFAFWPLRFLAGRDACRRSPLDLGLLGLLVAVAAALAVSPAPASSWEAAGYLLLGLAACLALLQWPPVQDHPERAAWLLLALCGLVALLGPLLLGNHGDKLGLGLLLGAGSWAQALGETVNPNVLGGALVVPTLLALALAIGPRWTRLPWRLGWAMLALAFAAELLATQCRGAWLGTLAGVWLLCILRWPRAGWLLWPAAILGLASVIAAGGASLAFDALGSRPETLRAGSGLADRLAIWHAAISALQQQPFTGIGLGLFGPWVNQHGLLAADALWQPHAHNLLLQVAADLGLPGLIAYGALLLVSAGMLAALLHRRPLLRRSQGHRTDTSMLPTATKVAPVPGARGKAVRIPAAEVYRLRLRWTLAAGSAAALAGLQIHGLVDAAQWGNKTAFLSWLLLALICLLFLDAHAAPRPDFLHPDRAD